MPGAFNIALIGYGKMGRVIEEIAAAKGYHFPLIITSANTAELTKDNLRKCDVAIEFTRPDSAIDNMRACIDAGIPVVCGSTGWYDHEAEIKEYCSRHNGALLYASNFSIGVNIFFEINKKLAALMAARSEYDVSIEEIHHTQKKDAPSGTAITLAQQIMELRNDKTGWSAAEPIQPDRIKVTSKRADPAPGTHHVLYSSSVDDIEIIHTAHSRQGFAAGALAAAEFIRGKTGIFSMTDVLKNLI